jgi:hypothetical protein
MLARNYFKNLFVSSATIQEFAADIRMHRIKLLGEDLCGCEIWFLTEQRKIFKN